MGKILDFTKKRAENIEAKRRNFERLVFDNFLGAHQEISKDGIIYPVTLVDISRDGCLFQIPWNGKRDKKLASGSEINMRMYFTEHTYIPVIMRIKNGRQHTDQNGSVYQRYGCAFDTSMPSFEAMSAFIEFLYKFAEHSTLDKGDKKVWFL